MDINLQSPIQYEVKKSNLFTLEFPADIGIETWSVKSVSGPELDIESEELQFLNTSTFHQGRYKWNPINVVIRDFIGPSQSQALIEWVRLGYESITGRAGYHAGSSKNLLLNILDPTAVIVSQWLLESCILTGAKFGDFDYTNSSVLELSFTVQPQRCILSY